MDETKSGMSWVWVLFVILIACMLFNGGLFGGGCGNNRWGGCDGASPCQIEKQEIIDSASTRYLIEQQGAATRAAAQAGFEALSAQNSRIYEQGLQEALFDAKMRIQQLEGNIFTKEQTDGIAKTLAECCCGFNRRLDAIECSMLKRPQLFGVASTCSGQIIPSTIANGGTVIA